MMLKRTSIAIAISLASALALSACNKNAPQEATPSASAESTPAAPVSAPAAATPAAPVTLVSVDLGSAVDPDQKVTTATTTFTPKDTIYASVTTDGTGNATLDAKWTYQDGQTVKDDSKTIAATGPATTAFSISKPDGWPAGNYKVEVSLNGAPAASKDFSVK